MLVVTFVVTRQMGILGEGFVAEEADKRFFSCVNPHVLLEEPVSAAHLATQHAHLPLQGHSTWQHERKHHTLLHYMTTTRYQAALFATLWRYQCSLVVKVSLLSGWLDPSQLVWSPKKANTGF